MPTLNCLKGQDADTIIATVEQIAPVFGAISKTLPHQSVLWLKSGCARSLDIPVMHDDQHGTAVVALAALRNALRIVE
ncbi:MAG: hypothetical protein U0074_00990 [Kouleothrix sp.]